MLTVDSLTSQVLCQQWFLLWVWYSHSCRTTSPTFTMGEIGIRGRREEQCSLTLIKGVPMRNP